MANQGRNIQIALFGSAMVGIYSTRVVNRSNLILGLAGKYRLRTIQRAQKSSAIKYLMFILVNFTPVFVWDRDSQAVRGE